MIGMIDVDNIIIVDLTQSLLETPSQPLARHESWSFSVIRRADAKILLVRFWEQCDKINRPIEAWAFAGSHSFKDFSPTVRFGHCHLMSEIYMLRPLLFAGILQFDARKFSWLRKFGRDTFSDLSDRQDEAARSAILEKVIKGRQPNDLMLRCV